MTTTFSFGTVPGLTGEEQRQLTELTEAYNYHQSRNATKDKYYEGHVTLQDVNLGIALPKGLSKLEVGCNWGQKAVDALASRSMFDGFVSNSGALGGLQKLVTDNRLVSAYAKACRDQLKYGCVFATLSADADIGCRSRLKRAIRSLIDDYVRTVANATIALEFDTTPQKYILGVTDEQYDAITSDKFKQYVGALIAATSNPETGENPVFGQLAQGNLQPHVEKMRMIATQFAAATGLTVMDVGVVNDANPTSSDAILAQSQTLVLMAQQLNTGNGDALHTIACMAQAIARNVSLTELTEDERGVMAHFKNPAMPSVAVTADAAIKIATARQEFASTDTFLEMIGFDQADIRRIRAQEQRARGQALLMEMDDADNDTDVE